MTESNLSAIYHGYISCLNARDWPNLGKFVDEGVHYNGSRIGLAGYCEMLEADCRAIPDLAFNIDLLVCEPPRIASRLAFDCTPTGMLFGMPVNGRRVRFAENVFYEFFGDRIKTVWSIIDKSAVASQI
ncbi:ester cyclase [Azospirillum picis]|uniref:Ester cyclase n=1 Tax=Azospirillum picis TaxID=488438 RepID=A0ABU0MMF6_9PROT|nr:ester cyclase [Azospirillum picis]MBP2300685.1 putative ester cyclase [Azospirillum picis]MDQ0534654.1 putative ester cyclase [Azospirillum picis]